jgi:hypothetical protein
MGYSLEILVFFGINIKLREKEKKILFISFIFFYFFLNNQKDLVYGPI